MTAEVAKAHLSLLIDLPKKAPDSKQALGEPDKSSCIGRVLETSCSSCDKLERTVKPKFHFDFDVSADASQLDPASSKNFLTASLLPFTFLHALFLPLRFAQRVTGSFNVIILTKCLSSSEGFQPDFFQILKILQKGFFASSLRLLQVLLQITHLVMLHWKGEPVQLKCRSFSWSLVQKKTVAICIWYVTPAHVYRISEDASRIICTLIDDTQLWSKLRSRSPQCDVKQKRTLTPSHSQTSFLRFARLLRTYTMIPKVCGMTELAWVLVDLIDTFWNACFLRTCNYTLVDLNACFLRTYNCTLVDLNACFLRTCNYTLVDLLIQRMECISWLTLSRAL